METLKTRFVCNIKIATKLLQRAELNVAETQVVLGKRVGDFNIVIKHGDVVQRNRVYRSEDLFG